ncbi:sigma-70 family RNA polymerase sigma factor [Streptomyces sp. NPDC046261]|uniref:sigma-70 family RNA polymerase sigma factor n=1 Tax=Streptomyces sp. NPDC046261 TaxID=3157200 RepID=UPI0033FDE041
MPTMLFAGVEGTVADHPAEDSGGAVGAPGGRRKITSMAHWPDAARTSYWAFHADRRQAYMSFAYLQLGSDADTEEAVDAAFDAIMDKWCVMLRMKYLEQYAWKILKHRIIDQGRRRRRRAEPMDIAAFEAALRDTSEDPFEVLADSIQLYSAVGQLTERQRDAVVLRYGMGYTTSEAAALMGAEEATVRSHLSQARRRLARLLEAESTGSDAPRKGTS